MCFEQTISTAAIASISGIITSTIVSLLITRYNSRKNEEKSLNDLLIQINNLIIKYPYFESIKYLSEYKEKIIFDEADLRYETYCVIVFNFLERLALYSNYTRSKMDEFVNISEMIIPHKCWWSRPSNIEFNKKGYNAKFRKIIEAIIREESCE